MVCMQSAAKDLDAAKLQLDVLKIQCVHHGSL